MWDAAAGLQKWLGRHDEAAPGTRVMIIMMMSIIMIVLQLLLLLLLIIIIIRIITPMIINSNNNNDVVTNLTNDTSKPSNTILVILVIVGGVKKSACFWDLPGKVDGRLLTGSVSGVGRVEIGGRGGFDAGQFLILVDASPLACTSARPRVWSHVLICHPHLMTRILYHLVAKS